MKKVKKDFHVELTLKLREAYFQVEANDKTEAIRKASDLMRKFLKDEPPCKFDNCTFEVGVVQQETLCSKCDEVEEDLILTHRGVICKPCFNGEK